MNSIWLTPALDATLVVLLAFVLWRLGSNPSSAWREREAKLREIFTELRGLVAQAEGLARDLDAKLEGHEGRLRETLAEGRVRDGLTPAQPQPPVKAQARTVKSKSDDFKETQSPVVAPPAEPVAAAGDAFAAGVVTPPSSGLVERVHELAKSGAPVEQIARELHELAKSGAPVEQIARELKVQVAEVQLLISLGAPRGAAGAGEEETTGQILPSGRLADTIRQAAVDGPGATGRTVPRGM
jgi:hypothetical protein